MCPKSEYHDVLLNGLFLAPVIARTKCLHEYVGIHMYFISFWVFVVSLGFVHIVFVYSYFFFRTTNP